ncbi:Serine protease [Phytophthora megakarya]|uniref:Serine protease n=1 Tax=Phytophthora megakarya TaxID=4795 RepID=A0A225V6R3_9STRA|nr:Serine protease [Phytophthora megakarya]
MTARKTRSVNRQLKIAYNALGIEDDDLSDGDYELEAFSEDEEEYEALSAVNSNEGSATATGKAACFSLRYCVV